MADFTRRLRQHETTLLVKAEDQSGSTSEKFAIITGSRIIITLQVIEISVGAEITVDVLNGFTNSLEFQNILSITSQESGVIKKAISNFHNLFELEINVSGGQASYAIGITVADADPKEDSYDQIILQYTAEGDLDVATFTKDGAQVKRLDLSYDADLNLTGVEVDDGR
jgi:hypothetical protein